MLWYNHSFAQICLLIGTFSQVDHVGLLFIWSIWFDLMFDVTVCCLNQIHYDVLCAAPCSFDQFDLMSLCAVWLRFNITCCVLHLVHYHHDLMSLCAVWFRFTMMCCVLPPRTATGCSAWTWGASAAWMTIYWSSLPTTHPNFRGWALKGAPR